MYFTNFAYLNKGMLEFCVFHIFCVRDFGIWHISHILRKGCWTFAYFAYFIRGDDYQCFIIA